MRLEQATKSRWYTMHDRHLGIQLAHAPDLAVLARDQPLVRGRQLDEDTAVGQVEVGPEPGHRRAGVVPAQGELDRLVLPTLARQVEERGEELLGGMGEADLPGGRRRMGGVARRHAPERSVAAHSPAALATARASGPERAWRAPARPPAASRRTMSASSSSTTPASGTMLNTP